ncbi:MAG: hypothetical protein D6736_02935 [Nitrospinota bacterium]|nr:MAG: hypothetical protein D6736_02935 [Nitrospinota bacterium]
MDDHIRLLERFARWGVEGAILELVAHDTRYLEEPYVMKKVAEWKAAGARGDIDAQQKLRQIHLYATVGTPLKRSKRKRKRYHDETAQQREIAEKVYQLCQLGYSQRRAFKIVSRQYLLKIKAVRDIYRKYEADFWEFPGKEDE